MGSELTHTITELIYERDQAKASAQQYAALLASVLAKFILINGTTTARLSKTDLTSDIRIDLRPDRKGGVTFVQTPKSGTTSE